MMFWAYLLAAGAALSCLGYGFGLARLLGIEANLGDAGVLGLLWIALVGCAVHFAWALSGVVEITVVGVGLALCILFGGRLRLQARSNLIPVLVGFSAFFHIHALMSYDNGLYHFQTLKWNSEFPIIPGLANLHARLAFNSALFLMAPLDDRPEIGWILNLILLMFVLISCAARFRQLRRDSIEAWFLILSIGALALFPERMNWLGVLNADGFAAILVVYWFCIVIALPSGSKTDASLLLLIAALAFTVKVSTAPLLPLSLAASWFHKKSFDLRPKAVIFAGAFLMLWCVRGIILSGCAVYPLAQSCISSLPWAVAPIQAANEALGIRSWAREPGRLDYARVMANWSWIRQWAARSWENLGFNLFVIGVALGCITFWRRVQVKWAAIYAIVCAGLCLIYWFVSAPDVRFGSGYLAVAGMLGLSFACASQFNQADVARRLLLEAIAVSIVVGAVSLFRFGNTWTIKDRPSFETRIAPGGKSVAVPLEGDQCWDHPLPCTPYFRPDDLKRVRWR